MSMIAIFAMSTIMAQENSNVQPPIPADVAESFGMLYPNVKDSAGLLVVNFLRHALSKRKKLFRFFLTKMVISKRLKMK